MSAQRRITAITGANRGIGYATAKALAARGDIVIVSARDRARAEAARAASSATAKPSTGRRS